MVCPVRSMQTVKATISSPFKEDGSMMLQYTAMDNDIFGRQANETTLNTR